jgi:hypothetical protein
LGSLASGGWFFTGTLIATGTGGSEEGVSEVIFLIIGNANITTPVNAVTHKSLRARAMLGSFSGA